MALNRWISAAVALGLAVGAHAQDQVTQFTMNDGTIVTLRSGQPAPKLYGSPPPFDQLDTDRDGSISRQEAEAYVPLVNDYDYLAPHTGRISRRQYDNWVRTQGR